MDRNLGTSLVATSPTDSAAYGDIYQWGRLADGHRNRTSSTILTQSTNNVPGHGRFILAPTSPYDWRTPSNNLWKGLSGTNNPYPSGFRLPTEIEFEIERASWSSNDPAGAFTSPLKLVMAGFRHYADGSLNFEGEAGLYWTASTNGSFSRSLFFSSVSNNASFSTPGRAHGFSIRCIKE